jgi:hypothetical protein
MILGPYETTSPWEPSVISGHSLGYIIKLSTLDVVEDIQGSWITSCRQHQTDQVIGDIMRNAISSRDRSDLVIKRTQDIQVLGLLRGGSTRPTKLSAT